MLSSPLAQIRKPTVSPENQDGDIWSEPDDNGPEENNPLFLPEDKARPAIKTERTEGPWGNALWHAIWTILWDPLQLKNLQGRYSRNPGGTETEYLLQACLSGGDK